MISVAPTAAFAMVTSVRHRRRDIRVRDHRHPIMYGRGSGGVGYRPETVHAEQAQQQSAHEQPDGAHHRVRSRELSEASHGVILSMHGS